MSILNLEPDTLLFITLAVLFCIEQLFCFIPGSYPYLYGLTVKRICLEEYKVCCATSVKLKVKTSINKNVVYMHYRYPFGVLGQLIFIGAMKKLDNVVEIKIGPFSLVFLAYIPFKSILFGGFISFGNFAIVGMLVLYIYYIFVQEVRNLGGLP